MYKIKLSNLFAYEDIIDIFYAFSENLLILRKNYILNMLYTSYWVSLAIMFRLFKFLNLLSKNYFFVYFIKIISKNKLIKNCVSVNLEIVFLKYYFHNLEVIFLIIQDYLYDPRTPVC